ncbi:zinc finger protein [Parasponia andersonii]|uniref:Zinc finger protein n=1 Tax=Parasponia andersonii TaxID=3476 RepID=A0A2P5BJS0_PARAD|nr:zinc finger protein [Parasponia andersonii]
METNGSNCNSHESQSSGPSNTASREKPTEKDVFINHAETAWHKMRKEWVGDQSHKSQRTSREPIMSWTASYEDLLSSTEPFQQPISLAEMVDFLVDIWHEEGLYD